MALTFRLVLTGPSRGLVDVLLAAEEPLARLRFRREPNIYRAEANEYEEEEVAVRSLQTDGEGLRGWTGLAVTYFCESFDFTLQLVQQPQGFVNGYIGLDRGAMARTYGESNGDQLRSAVIEVARAMGALGGFGATNLPFDPVPPTLLADAFRATSNSGPSRVMGLFARSAMSLDDIRELAGVDFEIREEQEYWWLEDASFISLLIRHRQ